MTQTHILNGLNTKELAASTRRMIRAQVSNDGTFPKGSKPPGQWYVQKPATGLYRVVHNLNIIKYGVSVGSLEDGLSIETKNLTDISFDVTIRKNNELYDASFVLALNFGV